MKLNFTAPINRTSYGYHSSYTLKYLTKLGWDVRHLPIGRNDPDPKFTIPAGKFHHDAPCLKLWHQFDMTGFTGSPTIGYSAFELEDLTEIDKHNMSFPNKMLVPTKWAQGVAAKSGIETSVVPLGFDPEIFVPTDPVQQSNTIFANFGKWEVRKGHDVLIRAFNSAFNKEDEVSLVMMPSNQFLNENQVRAWETMYLQSKLGDKIQLIPRVNTHLDVFNIMKQTDCGVFPARAEGFNLEALEMMACGKQIIITNCTGHTEFVDNSCKLIEMEDKYDTAYDGIFFHGFSKWRKFTQNCFDQLVSHMRDVHKNRSDLKTNIAAVNRANDFTWEKSINVLAKEISTTS